MENYINHRLKIAQAEKPIFTPETVRPVYQNSGGIPRRINQICDMSLLTGFSHKAKRIDEEIVREAVEGLGV